MFFEEFNTLPMQKKTAATKPIVAAIRVITNCSVKLYTPNGQNHRETQSVAACFSECI